MYMHKTVLYAHTACYMATLWVNCAPVDWGRSFIRTPYYALGFYIMMVLLISVPAFAPLTSLPFTASQAILETLQTSKMARNRGDTTVLGFKYLFNNSSFESLEFRDRRAIVVGLLLSLLKKNVP